MAEPSIKHFLVLGAGASYGARDGDAWPREERPALGLGLAEYLLDWLDANDPKDDPSWKNRTYNPLDRTAPSKDLWDDEFVAGFRAFLADAKNSQDFEAELGRLVDLYGEPDAHWISFHKINRVLAQSMLVGKKCRFPAAPEGDLYDQLLRQVGFPDNSELAVITLNYDILLEEAAARVTAVKDPLHVLQYPCIRGPENPVGQGMPVYKVHGSINWRGVNTHMGFSADPNAIQVRPAGWSLHEGKPIGVDTHETNVPGAGRTNYLLHLKHSPTVRPVLALYTRGKPVPLNQSLVEGVREACVRTVAGNLKADVTVIGLRPPQIRGDDPLLDELFELFRTGTGKKTFVNVSPDDCAFAAEFGFTPNQQTLREFLGV